MDETESSEVQASPQLPFTFRGVAMLARGPGWKLAVALLSVALLVAACCTWFLNRHWAPAMEEAIANLPATEGAIRDGRLHWPDTEWSELTPLGGGGTQRSAAKPYLVVDPRNRVEPQEVADLQIELREEGWVLSSMLGDWRLPYPRWLRVDLNQQGLGPWWGARRPFLLLGAGAAVVLWLVCLWPVAGLIGAWPVRTVAYFADREGGLGTHWRLAMAAMMPGAVLLAVGVVCHGLGLLPLLGLVVVFAAHLVVDWVYMFFAPFYLPRIGGAREKGNPFKDKEGAEESAGNPFAGEAKARGVKVPGERDG